METMTPVLGWTDLSARLALTVVAGLAVGFNRGEHGRPAGLRTTLLVALAAALAMIQLNLLLPMAGKQPGSFVTNDLMRLPLGILSGMGFIGGGAILRKGDLVQGVTTAATLWIMTVIGLCFGGGQLVLGAIGTVLTLATLWGLKWVEAHMAEEQRASLTVTLAADAPAGTIDERLRADGFRTRLRALEFDAAGRRRLELDLRWRGPMDDPHPPPCLDTLARIDGVVELKWASRAAPPV